MRTMADLADELGLHADDVVSLGHGKAKVELAALERPARGRGRLVLVSAITPTAAGEGKTTVSVGLAMGLRKLGRKVAVCLREPSLGPVFGIKGGGTGGGKATLVPATDINLHFTGDMHAITSAHNLLAAMVDNDLNFGAASGLDARRTTWPRAMDMNDRALRDVVVGLGGANGSVVRESRFDITAASEVMSVLCLSESFDDLRQRLQRIIVGRRKDFSYVTAGDLQAHEAMAALLQHAIKPNLVQTAEGGPAFVHGGPFANIAHGCSSVLATRMAMRYADDVVTEAGFGFDLGGEKFLDIKCRGADIWPRCVVLVATARALAAHGGADPKAPGGFDPAALERGLAHLDRQFKNAQAFGLTPILAVNVFESDSPEAIQRVVAHAAERGVVACPVEAFARGGDGAVVLAEAVGQVLDATDAAPPTARHLYDLGASYPEKITAVAKTIYGASGVVVEALAKRELGRIAKAGFGNLPVCIAKTHLSLSDQPQGGGLAEGFDVHVRSARLSAGAGFVVALLGDIMTMPGLPKEPAAMRVEFDDAGNVRGLMQGD